MPYVSDGERWPNPWRDDLLPRLLSGGWHDAELLHHPHGVPLAPVLDALPVHEPRYVDTGNRHLLPGRRNPHELALVGALHRPSDDDLVALRDDVVDRRPAVRERSEPHREQHLIAFLPRRHPG